MESLNSVGAQQEMPGKARKAPSPRPDPLQNVAESSFHPERSERLLSRSPTLASLPENGVTSLAFAQINTADLAHPARQFTDSSNSTSSNSAGLSSNRSSIAPLLNQPLLPQLTPSEQQLAAARQILEEQSAQFNAIRSDLRTVPTPHLHQSPRLPSDADLSAFPEIQDSLSWKIRTYRNDTSQSIIQSIIIVLHDHGGDHDSVKPLAKNHIAHPQTAFLCLGGISRLHPVQGQNGGLNWADEPNGNTYHRAVRLILEHVIGKVLVETCNFSPKNIAILGHGQGGSVALAIASIWDTTRFGGIITIDGAPPKYITSPRAARNPTPALLIGGELGTITRSAEQKTRDLFIYVDKSLRPGAVAIPVDLLFQPEGSDEIDTIKDFLAHSLRQEEWETQTVLTFDGGGIRGYGSLLIVKELMRRIGLEEKRLEENIDSSFYPSLYKPRGVALEDNRPITASSNAQKVEASPKVDAEGRDLGESARFLPCHYFNYIGGTSTGGLISIMLSRFRMTVDDCIEEYKLLGGKVFAHPRPLATGGILWHRFDRKDLEGVIQDVTKRNCFQGRSFSLTFNMDSDLCRTVVMAYSEDGTTDAPYLFRTYETFRRSSAPTRPGQIRRETTLSIKSSPIRNPGPASQTPIVQVGRATSAAPTYFPPVRILVPNPIDGGEKQVRFKDGGFGCNNPSFEVYKDVVRKHGGYSKNVSSFISVGTGFSELRMFDQEGLTRAGTRVREFFANLKAAHKMPTRTQGAHDAMLVQAYPNNKVIFPYSRFEGPKELGKIELGEWKSNRISNMMKGIQSISGGKTLQDIEKAVMVYLADGNIQKELDDQARLLVKRKRLRMRDESKWDRYASASWYECPMGTCKDAAEYKTYTAFEEHFRKEHQQEYDSEPFEPFAQTHRRCWLYRRR
ncbi:hypothetical protein EG329_008512 [Mollisiaceae sp. DMI_Dod_QoI]|nr:hypothetical protein EG329_008512 [Helotiales sp. DMI_Dod_QoI]